MSPIVFWFHVQQGLCNNALFEINKAKGWKVFPFCSCECIGSTHAEKEWSLHYIGTTPLVIICFPLILCPLPTNIAVEIHLYLSSEQDLVFTSPQYPWNLNIPHLSPLLSYALLYSYGRNGYKWCNRVQTQKLSNILDTDVLECLRNNRLVCIWVCVCVCVWSSLLWRLWHWGAWVFFYVIG